MLLVFFFASALITRHWFHGLGWNDFEKDNRPYNCLSGHFGVFFTWVKHEETARIRTETPGKLVLV